MMVMHFISLAQSFLLYVEKKVQSGSLIFHSSNTSGSSAYRTEVLREVSRLPQSSLELAESLEQLRWLQNGYKIKVGLTDVETIGIDTPEDLQHAEEKLRSL